MPVALLCGRTPTAALRRIATRYEKTPHNTLALIHLACALQWIDAQTSDH